MTDWVPTEQGLWCNSCGYLVATTDEVEAPDFSEPEECRQCGYPDPEAVADYHMGYEDDEKEDADAWMDDCGLMPNGYCTKAGSEECDWECPRGGLR